MEKSKEKKDDTGVRGGKKGKGNFKAEILKVLEELEAEDEWTDEQELARQNAIIEYYYGVTIDMHYPLLKKLNQIEHLSYCHYMDMRKAGVTDKTWEEIRTK